VNGKVSLKYRIDRKNIDKGAFSVIFSKLDIHKRIWIEDIGLLKLDKGGIKVKHLTKKDWQGRSQYHKDNGKIDRESA